MKSLEDRIKDSHMTRAHRRIAEFCLQNKQSLPLMSSAEIARRTEVSDVSVIRFVRSLGYESFVEFKHSIQVEIACMSSDELGSSPIVNYITQKGQSDKTDQNEDLKDIYVHNVEEIFSRNSPMVYEKAAKMILGSRNRYILGTRFRHTAAEICANLLRMTTPNVILMPAADYAAFQIAMDFAQGDCLIWFCMGRFTNYEKQILQFIQRSGISLIVITDQRASEIALEADLLIQSSGHSALPFYSSVANCIISEQLAHAVTEMGWVGTEKRLRDFEKSLISMEVK